MDEPIPVFNMDDPETKHRFASKIRLLTGLWQISLKPWRAKRTLQQNKYYWVGVVAPFTEWLRENYGDPWITANQAHEMLRDKILGEDERDGPLGTLPASTTRLNTEEFSEYVNQAAAWLAEFCEIVVIPADLFTVEKEQIKL